MDGPGDQAGERTGRRGRGFVPAVTLYLLFVLALFGGTFYIGFAGGRCAHAYSEVAAPMPAVAGLFVALGSFFREWWFAVMAAGALAGLVPLWTVRGRAWVPLAAALLLVAGLSAAGHFALCGATARACALFARGGDAAGPGVDRSGPAEHLATQQARDRYMGLRQGYPGSLNAVDSAGYTLLHHCAKHGYLEFAEEIINHPERTFSLDARDRVFGHTPFLLAVVHGRRDMAELLRKSGADVNAARPDGQNAAILAVRNGQALLIPYLKKIGVDFAHREEGGKTAMDYARQSGNRRVMSAMEALDAPGAPPGGN